jgi:hypothetical protein
MNYTNINRRQFLNKTSASAAGSLIVPSLATMASNFKPQAKLRVALVGTGIRGNTFWEED